MKITLTLTMFAFVALIAIAFNAIDTGKTNYFSFKPDDDNYKAAKMSFWKEYVAYKDKISRGIETEKPVDPAGIFEIDNRDKFIIKSSGNLSNSIVPDPKLSPDVVNTYVFTQSTTTYTSINGSGTLIAGSTNCDDAVFGPLPIGFTFTYNGSAQTQFGVCCNGFLGFGGAPVGSYTPLSSNTNNIAPFAYDLQLNTSGAIYYQTTGSAPNRVLTVEFYQAGFWPTTGNDLSFEIKLFETSNAVQIVYQTGAHTTTSAVEVGINGNPSTDFADRTTTSNWAATTAGGANSATCSFSPTIFPASGLTFQYAPPAPPPVPSLVRPVNHAIGRPQVDTLQWTASSGATNYNLQIALDSLFTTIVYNDTTLTLTQSTIGTFNPLYNWWWRVRAKNAIGWSAFTTQWTFKTIGPATGVTLLTPANNAVNQPINLGFVWSKATDQTAPFHSFNNWLNIKKDQEPFAPLLVANYWFALYTDTTQAPYLVDSTLTDTTRTVNGLTNNTNYWWKVRAKNQVGYGPFSAYSKFTTIVAAPAPPTLISPANNSTLQSLTPHLVWSSVPTATSYRVQLGTDSTFATTLLDSTTTIDSIIVPSGLLALNIKYYWHVRSINVGGISNYTAPWNFTPGIVGIANNNTGIPKVFRLYSNYPNPFNPSSTIKFDIPQASDVKMVVYNAIGQQVAILVNSHLSPGSYSVVWEASNYPSGVYFYKLTAGIFTDIHKMVLVK